MRRCMSQMDFVPVVLLIPSSRFHYGRWQSVCPKKFQTRQTFRLSELYFKIQRPIDSDNLQRRKQHTGSRIYQVFVCKVLPMHPVIVFLPYPCAMVNKPLLLRIVRLENLTIRLSLLFPMSFFLTTLNSQNTFWCTTWVSGTQTVIFTLRSCASLL